jgi:hypothetical protein
MHDVYQHSGISVYTYIPVSATCGLLLYSSFLHQNKLYSEKVTNTLTRLQDVKESKCMNE